MKNKEGKKVNLLINCEEISKREVKQKITQIKQNAKMFQSHRSLFSFSYMYNLEVTQDCGMWKQGIVVDKAGEETWYLRLVSGGVQEDRMNWHHSSHLSLIASFHHLIPYEPFYLPPVTISCYL